MNNHSLSWIANPETHEQNARQIPETQFRGIKKVSILYEVVCAAAIPHWFNKEILKALLPDLKTKLSKPYKQLLLLNFVEAIPQMQIYRIQEFERKWILEDLFRILI